MDTVSNMTLRIKNPEKLQISGNQLPIGYINLRALEKISKNRNGDTIYYDNTNNHCYKTGRSEEIKLEIKIYNELPKCKHIINPITIFTQLHKNRLYYVIKLPFYQIDLYDYIIKNLGTNENTTNFTEEQLINFSTQILTGLEALHYVGIIHRDIKPENILVKYNNGGDITLVLIDFGNAQSSNNQLVDNNGTYLYCAPEFLKSGRISSKYDIWSCGIILYIMMYGAPPWHTDKDYYYYKQVVVNNEIEYHNTKYSRLILLCNVLLHKNPADRLTATLAKQLIHNITYTNNS